MGHVGPPSFLLSKMPPPPPSPPPHPSRQWQVCASMFQRRGKLFGNKMLSLFGKTARRLSVGKKPSWKRRSAEVTLDQPLPSWTRCARLAAAREGGWGIRQTAAPSLKLGRLHMDFCCESPGEHQGPSEVWLCAPSAGLRGRLIPRVQRRTPSVTALTYINQEVQVRP